jgi:hypothetical protein
MIEISPIILEPFCEAHNCLKNNCYTACALMCRKLLMNLAVENGAKAGEPFESYISYLQENGILNPDMDYFFDREPEKIRTLGNDAAHKTKAVTPQNAKDILQTTKILLSLIYNFDKEMELCNLKGNIK